MSVGVACVIALSILSSTARPLGAQHDMSHMGGGMQLELPLSIPLARLGSGTSWLPDSSRSPMLHLLLRAAGDWTFMFHGAAFGQYDHQATLHGGNQVGETDWEMFMAARAAGGGVLRLTAMTSAEEVFVGSHGYPELLQSGGANNRLRIANREHPHEPLGEASVTYDHALTSTLASSLYLAPVGEPALGPVAYMHRPSAAPDPFAPIGHHWQDGTHESFGVVTGAVYSHATKLEASAFNARETPTDRDPYAYPGARLDSYAARLTVSPSPRVSVAAWGGYLFDDDPLDPGLGMQRYGASVLTTNDGIAGGAWSNALVWGMNIHHHGSREHVHDATTVLKPYHLMSSLLAESTLEIGKSTALFGRVEQVQKSADDLGFVAGDLMQLFTLRSVSLAATRDVRTIGSASFAVGGRASVNLVPETLKLAYQTRTPTGFAVYLRVRPLEAMPMAPVTARPVTDTKLP